MWEADPPMLTTIRVLIKQEGRLDPIEETTVRRPRARFAGFGLSYETVYTISVGSMETSIILESTSEFACILFI